mgnify:FL=1
MIKAGVIGGSGYTGGELLRLLVNHPSVEIDLVFSTTRAGQSIAQTHPDLWGVLNMAFTDTVNAAVDIVFLCLGHGNSSKFLTEHKFSASTKIVDLSNEFRLKNDAIFQKNPYIYGLPELIKTEISSANHVANPGCFATAIQLALLPLAQSNQLQNEVHINATTGSTGAGVSLSPTSHFSWRNNNISWYKPFTHQHLAEIGESLHSFGNAIGKLRFMPQRGNFTRGILATAYTVCTEPLEQLQATYRSFYADAPFVQVVDEPVHLKQVVNTNQCHVHLHKHEDVILITSVIDNLIKGASGQAVQNMNLMFGWAEDLGLNLKASIF